MSSRAAWRLTGLGFTQVFHYTPGKMDWMANGLPIEGEEARVQHASDLAHPEAPTCSLTDRIATVKERIQKSGWNFCVVVNAERIVLGLIRPDALDGDPQRTAGQVMENGPRTYRLDSPLEKTLQYMQKTGGESVLVTTSSGELAGILKRADVEKALSVQQQAG